ncbi:transglutaminase/protease-like domain-containing protein [Eubacterium sp. CAG:192]|nr:transglutaminase/protease-like domain-containing protein [Eubacterium sp. CAG:192]
MVYKLNDYTVFNKGDDGYELHYGLITSPFYSTIDWYSKKDYDKIMNEVKRIVKESKITDDMIDEEKAYRIGRYMVKHIDYDYNVYGQRIYETLFEKKTVCAGYAKTYALICRYIGIDCDFVYTTDLYVDGQNMNHAWNYIKLGDYYYVVDLTDAYVSRNSYSIVTGFFYQYDSLIEKYRKNVQSNYKTNDYMKSHKVDTLTYGIRCKNENIPYLTSKELYNLPE